MCFISSAVAWPPDLASHSRNWPGCRSDGSDSPGKRVGAPASGASDRQGVLPLQVNQIYEELFQIHQKLQVGAQYSGKPCVLSTGRLEADFRGFVCIVFYDVPSAGAGPQRLVEELLWGKAGGREGRLSGGVHTCVLCLCLVPSPPLPSPPILKEENTKLAGKGCFLK